MDAISSKQQKSIQREFATSMEICGQAHQPGQSSALLTVKEELFQAADQLIAELNKQGVTQGRKDIAEPRRRHPPILISMEEYEDYLASAKSYAIDKRFKRQEEQNYVGKKIKVENILQDVTTRDGRLKKCMHVLFSGTAGMGKTTLLRGIAQDGRKGKIEALKDKLILMPDFRTFSSQEKILPSKAVLGNLFSDHGSERMEERYQWILENSKDVAFLIDSLDTLPFDLEIERPRIGHQEKVPIDSILHNILSRDLFPKSTLISSSREYKVKNLHPSVRPDRFVVLEGLSSESVDELIDDFLGKKKGLEIKEHIATKCPAIGPLLTIPVFFILYVIGCVSGMLIPETMSGILVTFFLALANSPHVDAKTIQVILKKLQPLAFEGTRSGQILFTPEDMKRFGLTPVEASALGILIPQSQGTYLTSKLIQNNRFLLHFNHQTQQEFLAALFVLSGSTEKFAVFIMGDFNRDNFIVVRRFIYGVLLNDEVLEKAMKITNIPDVERKRYILFGNLESTFKTIDRDKCKLLEFFVDMNECKNGTATEIVQSLVLKMDFEDFNLSNSDVQMIASLMKQCKYLEMVSLENCNLNESKIGILSKTLMQSSLRLRRLNIGRNSAIGRGGMFYLGRFVKHSRIEEVFVRFCSLQSEHLQIFTDAADSATMKYLNVSGNARLGQMGMRTLGKMVSKHQLNVVVASWCNPNLKHVQGFTEGLGSAMISSLFLGDAWAKPTPVDVSSLLELLPHIRSNLHLDGWNIEEEGRQQLCRKISGTSVSIILGDGPLLNPTVRTNFPDEHMSDLNHMPTPTTEIVSERLPRVSVTSDSSSQYYSAESGSDSETDSSFDSYHKDLQSIEERSKGTQTLIETISTMIQIPEDDVSSRPSLVRLGTSTTENVAGPVEIKENGCGNSLHTDGSTQTESLGCGDASSSLNRHLGIPAKYVPVSRKHSRGPKNENAIEIPISISSEHPDILLKVLGQSDRGNWSEIQKIQLHEVRKRVVPVETDKFSHFIVVLLDPVKALSESSIIYAKGEVKFTLNGNFEVKFRGSTEFDPGFDDIDKNRLITLFHDQEFRPGDKIKFSLRTKSESKFQFNRDTIEFDIDRDFLRKGETRFLLLTPKPNPPEHVVVQYIVMRNGDVVKEEEVRIPFEEDRTEAQPTTHNYNYSAPVHHSSSFPGSIIGNYTNQGGHIRTDRHGTKEDNHATPGASFSDRGLSSSSKTLVQGLTCQTL